LSHIIAIDEQANRSGAFDDTQAIAIDIRALTTSLGAPSVCAQAVLVRER
jgi:hypothetical protein